MAARKKHRPNTGSTGSQSPDYLRTTPVKYNQGPTDYVEIQQNEIAVLRSIYMEDFEDVKIKAAAWSKSPDFAFRLRLKAHSGPSIKTTLFVRLPATYPKTPPLLKIEDHDCGDPMVRGRLQGVIESKPKELLGSEMIFEIASQVQDILEDAAAAKADREGLSSLEAEMMFQRKNMEQDLKELEEVRRRQQQDAVAEEDSCVLEQINTEINRRESKVRAVEKVLRDRRGSRFATDEAESAARIIPSLTFPRTMHIADKGGNLMAFSNVICLPPILSNPNKRLSLVIPRVDKESDTPTLFLKDIYLHEAAREAVAFRSKMTEIEELLKELAKKRRHPNVVDLFGFRVDRTLIDIGDGSAPLAKWELSILTEYAQRGSLSDMLEASGSFVPAFVRSYTKQILDGLEFFDQHGYVHPSIHLNNILLFPSRTGKPTIKLSDGYGLALKDMVSRSRSSAPFTSSELPQWTAPELNDNLPRRSNKTCIWELGRVVLEMIHG